MHDVYQPLDLTWASWDHIGAGRPAESETKCDSRIVHIIASSLRTKVLKANILRGLYDYMSVNGSDDEQLSEVVVMTALHCYYCPGMLLLLFGPGCNTPDMLDDRPPRVVSKR